MREFNETPYQVLHRDVIYEPGKPFMSVVAKGTFSLKEDAPCSAVAAARQVPVGNYTNYHDEHGNAFKTPMDTAPFKQRGEWLFIGAAHPPGGEPVTELDVRVEIGGASKSLTILGNRDWVRDTNGSVHMSKTEPFTEMPIRAEFAHGGLTSKFNQHGIGFEELPEAAGSTVAMANILTAGTTGVGWDRDAMPSGFGMLAPNLEPRRSLLGTYDERWRVRRMPMPPVDFDPAYFNAAPEDQQIDGFFRGDETIVLHNLHPEKPLFRTQLPGTRVRCFVNQLMDLDDPESLVIAEIITVLDTVIVDVPDGTLTLVWRGTFEIEDMRHREIQHILYAEEPVDDPRPADAYAAILQDKLVDKAALAAQAEKEERLKKVAELDAQGRANVIKALKDGKAPDDLIAEVEKQESVEAAQKIMLDWVKQNFGHLMPKS